MTWVNWNKWLGMTDFKWRNWSEWIELNEWNEWIQTNELTWTNWNEKSRAHLSTSLSTSSWKKWSEAVSFLRCLCEIELSLQSRPHFVAHFQDHRGAQPRKQTPSSGDHGQPLYPKKHRVLRPRVFSAVNSRVPDRSHFLTTWWWHDWHDDVLDMMVRQLAVTIDLNSEVS